MSSGEFLCNLGVPAKGICCIEGDAGAPVELDEVRNWKRCFRLIWMSFLPKPARVIEEQGVVYTDQKVTGDFCCKTRLRLLLAMMIKAVAIVPSKKLSGKEKQLLQNLYPVIFILSDKGGNYGLYKGGELSSLGCVYKFLKPLLCCWDKKKICPCTTFY